MTMLSLTDEQILERSQKKIIRLYDLGLDNGIKEPLMVLICQHDEVQIQAHDREELLAKLGNPESLNGLTECEPGHLWCVVVRETRIVPYKMLLVRDTKSIGQS
jgi:hypothetical protein